LYFLLHFLVLFRVLLQILDSWKVRKSLYGFAAENDYY
jgi:hypothetical protein